MLFPYLDIEDISLGAWGEVQEFSCGDEPWCAPIDQYFHNDALEDHMERGYRTYLVRQHDSGLLIAMATFGAREISYPRGNSSKRREALIVMNFGLDRLRQGQKHAGLGLAAACFDLSYLRAVEEEAWRDLDLIGLYVDEENVNGRAFWQRYGFYQQEKTKPYVEGGRLNWRMILQRKALTDIIQGHIEATEAASGSY
jgi:ribosomal protein S18 acetylase RimI-like enzyme